MIRSVHMWLLGLTLVANALSVGAPIYLSAPVYLNDEDGSQALSLALSSPPSCPAPHDGLLTEPAAMPPALGPWCARQGKQNLVPARPVAVVPQVREHMPPPQPVLASTFFLWRFLPPRTLPPASVEDDPFLN
jgi:hypothetical protein